MVIVLYLPSNKKSSFYLNHQTLLLFGHITTKAPVVIVYRGKSFINRKEKAYAKPRGEGETHNAKSRKGI